VARHLLYEADTHGRPLTHLRFVWAIRNPDMMHQLPTVVTDASVGSNAEEPTVGGTDATTTEKPIPRFQPEVYLTKPTSSDDDVIEGHKKKGQDDVEMYHLSKKGDSNAVHGPVQVIHGRPDIKALVEEIVTMAASQNVPRVAVVTCGPSAMIQEVERTCRLATGLCGKVALDVHAEIFSY
jgi:hypothetical protein